MITNSKVAVEPMQAVLVLLPKQMVAELDSLANDNGPVIPRAAVIRYALQWYLDKDRP